MKNITLILSLVACLGLANGCHYYEKQAKQKKTVLNSWMGAHKSKLIANWGPPTRYDSDGDGGEILMYEQYRTTTTLIYGTYVQNYITYYTYMYADPKGYLYHWQSGQK